MKTFLSKAGKGLFFGGMLSVLCSGLAVAAEKGGEHGFPPPPPIPGIGDRYLGTCGTLKIDGKSVPVVRGKSGYVSVLLFPGRTVRKIFLGGGWWTGAVTRSAGVGVVILDPPVSPQVDSNLVVVFDHGVSIFRLKTVSQDKPFMARTTVRFEGKNQRAK